MVRVIWITFKRKNLTFFYPYTMNSNGVDRNAHKHKATTTLALHAQNCLSCHDGFGSFQLMFISLTFTIVLAR